MRIRSKLVAAVLLMSLGGYVTAQSKTADALKKERLNLERTNDPVAHTKVDIKISNLLITLITDAARAGDDKLALQYLNEYSDTIQEAQTTLMKTGKDAHKHPGGFKDLEIALRKQQRLLADAGKLADYEQRDAFVKAQKLASEISDQLVRAMLLKDPNAPRKP